MEKAVQEGVVSAEQAWRVTVVAGLGRVERYEEAARVYSEVLAQRAMRLPFYTGIACH